MKRIYTFLVISALAACTTVFAQTAQFLTLPADARTMSMGGTGVVAPANAFSIYNNNAAAAFSPVRGALAASYTLWQPGITGSNLANLSGFFKIGKRSAFLIGSRFYLNSEHNITNEYGSITGTYRPVEISIDLGYAYKITETFSTAATLRYIISRMGPDASGGAIAADLGLLYNPGNVSIGLTGTNLGSKIDYGYGPYELPAQIRLGAGYRLHIGEKHLLLAAAQAGFLIKNSGLTAGVGLEYVYNKMVSARLGGHYGDPEKGIPPHLSLGLGFTYRGLALNAAYLVGQKGSAVSNSLSFGLEWAF
jgi:hypothetical protein